MAISWKGHVMSKKAWGWIAAAVVVIGVAIVAFPIRTTESNIVKVGVVLPLTGAAADQGKDILSGIELARDEINAHHPDGPGVSLLVEDDQSMPKGGVSALEKIIQTERPPVVIGPVASSVMLAMIPIAEREKVVLLSPAASSPKISKSGKYIFRISLLAPPQAEALAQYARSDLKAHTAAILYVNDDTGLSYCEAFRGAWIRIGGALVFEDAYDKTATDFRTHVTKIKVASPDVTFVPGVPQTIGLIMKQAKELGLKTQFLANYGAEGASLLAIGGNAAEGLVYASIPISEDFASSFRARFGRHPTIGAPLGYDALQIVWEVAREKGLTSEDMRRGLCRLSGFRGATGLTSMLNSGDAEKDVRLKTVRNGAFVALNPSE